MGILCRARCWSYLLGPPGRRAIPKEAKQLVAHPLFLHQAPLRGLFFFFSFLFFVRRGTQQGERPRKRGYWQKGEGSGSCNVAACQGKNSPKARHNSRACRELKKGGGYRGKRGGVLDRRDVLGLMHGRSRMTIDPRTPTMLGRSTSGFRRPGRHCLHQAR